MVLNNYEVDPTYFEEKYGMPVGERRSNAPVAPTEPPQDDKKPESEETPTEEDTSRQAATVRPFFD